MVDLSIAMLNYQRVSWAIYDHIVTWAYSIYRWGTGYEPFTIPGMHIQEREYED